jgi:hypothetical protein
VARTLSSGARSFDVVARADARMERSRHGVRNRVAIDLAT